MTDPVQPASQSRSRRAVLAGALGGLAAWAVSSVDRVSPTRAASGDPLILGSTANTAGTANTSLSTSSTGTALLVTQNGTGTALRGSAVGPGSIAGFFTASNGTGISGVTGNPNASGVFASNDGASGSGGAIRASGKNNHGVVATTNYGGANALRATNAGVGGAAGSAIFADAAGNCTGVTARADANTGVFGFSTNAQGVYGASTNSTGVQGNGTTGVYGSSTSTFGTGVEGVARPAWKPKAAAPMARPNGFS